MGMKGKSALFPTLLVVLLLLVNFTHGRSITRGRIVGGYAATYRNRRSVALMFTIKDGVAYKHCTSSILSDRFILTAAHCLHNTGGLKLGVLPAAYDVGSNHNIDVTESSRFVKNVFVHKSYFDSNGGNRQYDLAILELERPILDGTYTPVALADTPMNTTRVTAIGYGTTGEFRPTASILQQAVVVARSFQWCIEHEENQDEIYDLSERTQFCATSIRYPEGRTDTCYGDSGGPLMLIDPTPIPDPSPSPQPQSLYPYKGRNGSHTPELVPTSAPQGLKEDPPLKQIGITSFSFAECAQPGSTPWYIRVEPFRRGINHLLKFGNNSDMFFKMEAKEWWQ